MSDPRGVGRARKGFGKADIGKPKPTSLVLKPRSSGAGPKAKHHKSVREKKSPNPRKMKKT